MYRIELKPSCEKQLYRLPKNIQTQIRKALDKLQIEPRNHSVKKLSGLASAYRMRVGDYRIVFTIEDNILFILVIRIGHRKDIYELLR